MIHGPCTYPIGLPPFEILSFKWYLHGSHSPLSVFLAKMTTRRSDKRHSRDMALRDSYDVTACLDPERAASTIQVRDWRAHRYDGRP